MMNRPVALILLCLAALSAQAGELFRWVDADGKVHYTDQPPPAGAKDVEQKKLGDSTIGTSDLPYATQQAMKNFPVTLYVSDDCGKPCESARELLSQRGVPYTTKNPQSSPDDYEALKKLIGEAFVPVLVVGTSARKGFNKGAWDAELDSAGYPKSGPKKPAGAKTPAAKPIEENVPPHPWARGR